MWYYTCEKTVFSCRVKSTIDEYDCVKLTNESYIDGENEREEEEMKREKD